VYSIVLDEPMLACDTDFIAAIKLRDIRFDAPRMRADRMASSKKGEMVVA